jgi:dephospho-CoA kinase
LNNKEKVIIIDAALLFTIGLHKYCSQIIFVNAPEELIAKRLEKKGLSKKEIVLRIRANQSVLKLKSKCTAVIDNDSTKEQLSKKIDLMLKSLSRS